MMKQIDTIKISSSQLSSTQSFNDFGEDDFMKNISLNPNHTIGKSMAHKISIRRAVTEAAHSKKVSADKASLRKMATAPVNKMAMPTIIVPAEEMMYDEDDQAIQVETKQAEEMLAETQAKEFAKKLYDEECTIIKQEDLCEWLGKRDEWRARVLTHYLNNFDFEGMRLDDAFRCISK